MPSLSLDRLLGTERLSVSFAEKAPRSAQTFHVSSVPDLGEVLAATSTRGAISTPSSGWTADWTSNSGGDALMLVGDLSDPAVDWIDWESGRARVRGGALVEEVTTDLLANGWCPHTLGADPLMSIGAAVGANIATAFGASGGRFADGIKAIEIVDGNGSLQRLERSTRPDAYFATIGGLGLTGVVVAVEMQVRAVSSAWMLVDCHRVDDFDALVEQLESSNESDSTYAVIDPTGTGTGLGRGSTLRARHAKVSDLPPARATEALAYQDAPAKLPSEITSRFWRNRASQAWQTLRHQTSAPVQEGQLQSVPQFFGNATTGVPERSPDWVRYEAEIQPGAINLVPALLETLQRYELPSQRVVLSRIADSGADLLNSVGEGWRFGLSIPADDPSVSNMLDRFDERILSAKGHVLLASDGRMRPEFVQEMFPTVDEWRAQRARLDPDQRFQSDFSRRLGL